MHFLSFHLFALFITFLSPIAAAPPVINNNYAPYKHLTISTPTGPLTVLQSIKIPNFTIAPVWNYDRRPTWLRTIDVASTDLLLDILIARYATRPSDDTAAEYGTVGPESSPALSKLETRVIVKQWVPTNWTRIPTAPMRNQDIAYAAQLVKGRYSYKGVPKKESGWKMLYISEPDEKGMRYLANCTGVLMVQRDLYYPGEYEDQPTTSMDTRRVTDVDSE